MKKKMVRYTLDTLPLLTDAQRAHFRPNLPWARVLNLLPRGSVFG
ncbi:MAG TPA: hypothetical protein VMT20_05740 [Terriglobia bacterium]|nr:hypothetical protein [Terriglobia bacterium]